MCNVNTTLPHKMWLQQFACSSKMLGGLDNIATTSCVGLVVVVAEQHIIHLNLRYLYQVRTKLGQKRQFSVGKTFCHQKMA